MGIRIESHDKVQPWEWIIAGDGNGQFLFLQLLRSISRADMDTAILATYINEVLKGVSAPVGGNISMDKLNRPR